MDPTALRVTLAAVVHDVGKWMQRAELGLSSRSRSDQIKDLLCPRTREGYHTHLHVLWTHDFCETYIPQPWWGEGPDNLVNLAAFHHKPETYLQGVVAAADRLSSGMERTGERTDETLARGQAQAYKRVRLRAVLDHVSLHRPSSDRGVRFELRPLAFSEEILFPKEADELDPPHGDLLVSDYRALWEGDETEIGFLKRLGGLNREDPERFLTGLHHLLERYTWCIPSDTMAFPDISLFDHLKTTAALARCLYDAGEESERPFLLVAADVGGIQRFIYRITQSQSAVGAAKRLRGRSAYVSLLAEMVGRFVLRQLDLPLPHLLYVGGGAVQLLVPNTAAVKEALPVAWAEIDTWLLAQWGGDLGIVHAELPLSERDLKEYARAVGELADALAQAKQRRHFDRIVAGEWELEGPIHETCRSCHSRSVESGDELCPACLMHEAIGARLARTRLFGYRSSDARHPGDSYAVDFGPLGRVDLLEAPNGAAYEDLVALNEPVEDVPGLRAWANTVPLATEAFAYGENVYQPGDVVSLEYIATLGEGDDRLGFVKMDVDHLGFVFSHGLPAAQRSISRVSTLSRQIEAFFSGFVPRLLRTWPEEAKRVSTPFYTVYAGGDDVLLVGPWEQAGRAVQAIQQAFARYSGHNPNTTLSAAVFMAPHRYPLGRASRRAGALLQTRAKDAGRNRVAILGESLPWQNQRNESGFEEQWELGQALAEAVKQGHLHRGFLHRLLRISHQYWTNSGIGIAYFPALAYAAARTVRKDAPAPNAEGNLLPWLLVQLLRDGRALQRMAKIRVAAGLALLKTRKG